MTPTTLLWLVTGCLMLQPLSTDLYLATLPGMAGDFGVSAAAVQNTLSLFVIGFGTAQLVSGPLSDRFGRKPVMITARILFLLAIWPAFTLIIANHDAVTLITATGILSAFSSTSVGIALVALTESMRKDVRSTGLAILYAVVVAIFGGMAQPMVAWVMKFTGDPMAPAWYLMLAAGIGITAMFFLKETKPEPIDDDAVAFIQTA